MLTLKTRQMAAASSHFCRLGQYISKYYHKLKEDLDLIKKGYSRIQEKIKEIRQNFSPAIVSGRRRGSGMLVFEFYDELVKVWSGTAAVEPLSSGVDTDSFSRVQEVAHPANTATTEALLDISRESGADPDCSERSSSISQILWESVHKNFEK